MGTGGGRGADKPHSMEKPIPSHLLGNWWMLLVSSQVGHRQQLYRLLPLLTGLRIRIQKLAGKRGIEPRTDRLTADCSTAELYAKKLVAGGGFEPPISWL